MFDPKPDPTGPERQSMSVSTLTALVVALSDRLPACGVDRDHDLSEQPATGASRLSAWLRRHAHQVGRAGMRRWFYLVGGTA